MVRLVDDLNLPNMHSRIVSVGSWALLALLIAIYLYMGFRGVWAKLENPVTHHPIDGMHFTSFGRAHTEPPQAFALDEAYELSVVFRADSFSNGGIIASFVDQSDLQQVVLWQWDNQIIFMHGRDYSHQFKQARISFDYPEPYRGHTEVPWTKLRLTANRASGTELQIDIDGARYIHKKNVFFPIVFNKARLLLGADIRSATSWSGSIRFLELHNAHGEALIKYDFQEAAPYRRAFKNDGTMGLELLFPRERVMFKKDSFASVRQRLYGDSFDKKDALINYFGFIPWGLYLALFLSRYCRVWLAMSLAMGSGVALSFSIEYLQAYSQTRDSSQLDFFLNSVGAFTGVLLAWLSFTLYAQFKRFRNTQQGCS